MDGDLQWPTFTTDFMQYINLNANISQHEQRLEIDKCVFWIDSVPMLDAGDYSQVS